MGVRRGIKHLYYSYPLKRMSFLERDRRCYGVRRNIRRNEHIDVQVMIEKSELAFPPLTYYSEYPADTQQRYKGIMQEA
jgi:hypothetical protein